MFWTLGYTIHLIGVVSSGKRKKLKEKLNSGFNSIAMSTNTNHQLITLLSNANLSQFLPKSIQAGYEGSKSFLGSLTIEDVKEWGYEGINDCLCLVYS